jgi:hypothetical protein
MRPRLRFRAGRAALSCALALPALTALSGRGAALAADGDPPLVHPIYAKLPDLAEDDATRRAFAAATARYKLAPLETIDVPPAPPPTAPALLKSGAAKTLKLAFDDALPDLDAAIAELETSGGVGLTPAELGDVFFYRAWAVARADWKAPAANDAASMSPTRTRAAADYARAATLAPDRAVNPREIPPQVVADFARAVAEARQQPRATLTVKGDADAEVSLDGAPPLRVAGGVTFRDVVYGEHFLAVDELGRARWGERLAVGAATVEETIPARAALALDDRIAADHARRMGTLFALVGERKPGPGAKIELRLIDLSGAKRDAVLFSTTGDDRAAIDAAVMRLDEEARRIQQVMIANGTQPPVPVVAPPDTPPPVLAPPPPPRATLNDDPLAWARDRWPLMTAIGVVVGSALVLSIAAHN